MKIVWFLDAVDLEIRRKSFSKLGIWDHPLFFVMGVTTKSKIEKFLVFLVKAKTNGLTTFKDIRLKLCIFSKSETITAFCCYGCNNKIRSRRLIIGFVKTVKGEKLLRGLFEGHFLTLLTSVALISFLVIRFNY